MVSFTKNADRNQSQAILADGHALVSACPGAGKTRVLSLRAARLLTENPSGRLVAVTFTRDAARSLRQRIIDQAGEDTARRVAAGTFHALALKQLQRQRRGGSIRLLSPQEQNMLIKQAFKRSQVECEFTVETLDDARAVIEEIKASMEPPPDPKVDPAGAVFSIYQDMIEQSGASDFSDLLLRSVRDMRAGTLSPIGARWMLVDEAQDMDDVQYAWIKAHAAGGTKIMCVADDDQSIYQFRHALGYDGLMRFKRDLGATHVTLPTNYRCRPEILMPAAELIGHNTDRVKKDIQAHRKPGGAVLALANDERDTETTRMVNLLLDSDPGQWAVLARTNVLLDAAQIALSGADIPFKRLGGKDFWEKPSAQAYVGMLKAVDTGDSLALLQSARWAGFFRDDNIVTRDGEDALSLMDRLGHVQPGDKIGPSQRAARTLKMLLTEWGEAIEADRISIAAWGVARWLAASVSEERGQVFEWCARALCKIEGSLSARLARLTMKQKPKNAQGCVQLMTMHAAKGLEFPNVWIMACEDGICPHADSGIDEERRLFYVAMTRAENALLLSFTRDEAVPSRFLDEANLRHLITTTIPDEWPENDYV